MPVFAVGAAESDSLRVGGRREERGKLLSALGGSGRKTTWISFQDEVSERHLAIKESYISAEKLKALTN